MPPFGRKEDEGLKIMAAIGTPLSRHILEEGQRHPELAGELSTLLAQIAFAAKILAREMSRAALVGKLGLVGEKNATGDAPPPRSSRTPWTGTSRGGLPRTIFGT
jgi:Fructose-1-6-bisphosphatase, N-terminal domain